MKVLLDYLLFLAISIMGSTASDSGCDLTRTIELRVKVRRKNGQLTCLDHGTKTITVPASEKGLVLTCAHNIKFKRRATMAWCYDNPYIKQERLKKEYCRYKKRRMYDLEEHDVSSWKAAMNLPTYTTNINETQHGNVDLKEVIFGAEPIFGIFKCTLLDGRNREYRYAVVLIEEDRDVSKSKLWVDKAGFGNETLVPVDRGQHEIKCSLYGFSPGDRPLDIVFRVSGQDVNMSRLTVKEDKEFSSKERTKSFSAEITVNVEIVNETEIVCYERNQTGRRTVMSLQPPVEHPKATKALTKTQKIVIAASVPAAAAALLCIFSWCSRVSDIGNCIAFLPCSSEEQADDDNEGEEKEDEEKEDDDDNDDAV